MTIEPSADPEALHPSMKGFVMTPNAMLPAPIAAAIDPLVAALRDLAVARYPVGWTGAVGDLLLLLNHRAPFEFRSAPTWPVTSAALDARLDHLTSYLATVGVIVDRDRGSNETSIIMAFGADNPEVAAFIEVVRHQAGAHSTGWRGQAHELLGAMNSRVPPDVLAAGVWPTTPRALLRCLARMAAPLLASGIRFARHGRHGVSLIPIEGA